MKTVYLLSYPRSGNSMLASMMLACMKGITFNSIYHDEPNDAPRFLRELEAVDVRPSAEPVWNVLKSHHWTPEMATGKIIWLVRDGRDAMASYFHFAGAPNNDPISFWKSLNGEPARGIGTRWDVYTHAIDGLIFEKDYFMMRYEDLHTQPERAMEYLAAFLDVPYDNAALKKVAFDRMHTANAKFYRRGEVGSYRDLPPDAVSYLEDTMRTTLKNFGYLR